ncbi:hypothetical protein ACXWPT_09605, partial [Streptococcus pyogenes]
VQNLQLRTEERNLRAVACLNSACLGFFLLFFSLLKDLFLRFYIKPLEGLKKMHSVMFMYHVGRIMAVLWLVVGTQVKASP